MKEGIIRPLIAALIFILFMTSCDLPADLLVLKKDVSSGGPGAMAQLTMGSNWYLAALSEPFVARNGFGLVDLTNTLWMLGGSIGAFGYLNDVWTSQDGTNWTSVSPAMTFNPCSGEGVAFNGMVWFISERQSVGMTNIVYVGLADGLGWYEATNGPAFGTRDGFGLVSFNNSMWVIAGTNNPVTFLNDVWYSPDGTNWSSANASAAFPGTIDSAFAVFNNAIWMIGGFGSSGPTNGVWNSSDGTNWICVNPAAAFSSRWMSKAAVANGILFLVGGITATGLTNDIWYSLDGANWYRNCDMAPFQSRVSFGCIGFKNSLWVVGGLTEATNTNDVWVSY